MSYSGYYKGGGGSRGGRGFGSRGSFRGRGGESGGRGRASSRGRFNWYKERSSGFESRSSRYISGGGGGGGGGGGPRYSGYRRYRGDEIDYPSRERYHRSPDIPRKRMRTEHSYLQLSDDDDELIEGELAIKRKLKKLKKDKVALKEDEPEEGEEVEDDVEGEEEGGNEGKKKIEEKASSGANNTKDQDSDAGSDDGKKPIYDLTCPHCLTHTETVQKYQIHMFSSKHINAMRKQSLLHKQTLQRMRMNQRHKQRIMEESDEIRDTLSDRTKFCPICKLNYKQPKSTHMTSEDHEEMVRFLNPYCKICKQRFNSPMYYEHHICSLDHIKFKALLGDKSKSDEEDGGKDDEKELNLENFMILDSVGSVDETGEEGESGGEEKPAKPEGEEKDKEKEKDKDKEKDKEKDKDKEKKSKSKPETNIGSEYTRKVEVYYCDLCRTYLPWYDEQERALGIHCRSRSHLQRYVRYREDKLLRKEAERLHQKRMAKRKAEKEARTKKSEKKTSDEKSAENKEKAEKDDGKSSEGTANESPKKKKTAENGEAQSADAGGQEQDADQDIEMGTEEDLDKEIGGILDGVEEGNKSSDEDEDSRGRYDRFQNSAKGSTKLQDEEDVAKTAEEQTAEGEGDDDGLEKSVESKPEAELSNTSAADPASNSVTTSAD